MKIITDLIIQEKNSNSIFVFPSEAAAVARRREFLNVSGKYAVKNDRFLSWDRFKEKITLHDREDKPVNSILRRIFAADIIRRNSEEQLFSRLIPPEYRTRAGAFSDSIYLTLPDLEPLVRRMESGERVFEVGLSADFHKLYHLYIDFMRTNALFEPSWERPELIGIDGGCYIICPEIIDDFSEYEMMLKKAGCRLVGFSGQPAAGIRLFENSVVETDTVINEITELLNSGTVFQDIAVTAADENTAELFLSKAALRGLPVNYRSGKPLSGYPAGRLPELLRACRNSSYSLTSMKDLLMFRAFVWKEADTAAALVRFGIENRCLKNTSPRPQGDVWANRLKSIWINDAELPPQCSRKAMLEFYRKLRAGIEKITAAAGFEELSREFQVFVSTFLKTGAEDWDPECEKVFQRTREVLSSLREVENRMEGIVIPDALGLWIEILNEKIYVQQLTETGIALFPYRVSALVNPRYHFIIGCSNDASLAVSTDFSFLTDQQRRDIGASEHNMTDDFIAVYASSGDDVRFTCSTDTFGGTALPPGYFIERSAIERLRSAGQDEDFYSDPVQAENRWWVRACGAGIRLDEAGGLPRLSAQQLEGFSYASASFMEAKDFDAADKAFPAEVVSGKLIPAVSDKDNGFFRVSATSLNRWSVCRFNMLLSDILGISEDEYILRAEDPLTAGSVMHDVLYDFFLAVRESGEPFRFSGNGDRYKSMITESTERVFAEWEGSRNYFYGPAWESLKRRVLHDLQFFPAAEAEYFDGLKPGILEEWLEFNIEEKAVRVFGKVDRISTGAEGSVIVDYKKRWDKQSRAKFISEDEAGNLLPPEKGYQLPLYILLAERNGMSVDAASYYSIATGSHYPVSGGFGVLDDDDVESLCNLTLDEISCMAEVCRGGDFTAETRCDGCGFRAVCRKRFNVRWICR